MAERYNRAHWLTPSEQVFTRQRVMAALFRSLQENVQHFYGTRVTPLVKDWDIFLRMPAAFGTTPEYLVTVSRGCTDLYGTIVWTAESWQRNGTSISVQFYSERADDGAGVAVAAGTDATPLGTPPEITDRGYVWDILPAWPPPARDGVRPANLVIEGSTPERVYTPRILGGENGPSMARWSPTLTTSHDLRIRARTKYTSLEADVAILLGVFVWEGVPIGG